MTSPGSTASDIVNDADVFFGDVGRADIVTALGMAGLTPTDASPIAGLTDAAIEAADITPNAGRLAALMRSLAMPDLAIAFSFFDPTGAGEFSLVQAAGEPVVGVWMSEVADHVALLGPLPRQRAAEVAATAMPPGAVEIDLAVARDHAIVFLACLDSYRRALLESELGRFVPPVELITVGSIIDRLDESATAFDGRWFVDVATTALGSLDWTGTAADVTVALNALAEAGLLAMADSGWLPTDRFRDVAMQLGRAGDATAVTIAPLDATHHTAVVTASGAVLEIADNDLIIGRRTTPSVVRAIEAALGGDT